MIDLLKKVVAPYKNSEWGVSLSFRDSLIQSFVFSNGEVEDTSVKIDKGIMVEVSRKGKVLRMGITRIDRDYIRQVISYLKEQLEQIESSFIMHSNYRLSSNVVTDFTVGEKFDPLEVESTLANITKVKQKNIDLIRSSVQNIFEERIIVNSIGGLLHDKKNYVDFQFKTIGSKGVVVQSRSNGGVIFQGHIDRAFYQEMIKTQNEVINDLLHLLEAPPCPKFIGDILLPPDQMYIQIHESIGHPLELDRILGDERNYAGGSFVKKEDFGNLRYGPKNMNVIFNPSEKSQPATQGFDDTGEPTESIYLIKEGILQAGIGGQESQKRLGVQGTMSTRSSSWNRPPIDRMGNINLLAGQSSFEEMVSTIENGVLMRTNQSWSIDDQRDKFQFGCEIGQMIKDGELGGYVRVPSYEGRTIPFWNSLTHVGADSTVGNFGTSYCGKGEPNQAIRVGHQSPACVFKDISIFPGE